MKLLFPQNHVFWFLKQNCTRPLRTTIQADVAIIGGGMAGLCAAYAFQQKGLSVALVEKGFCASGASGKSSGFITPDSEFSLSDFVETYGAKKGVMIWEFVSSGVDLIRHIIKKYHIACDFRIEDTVVLASSEKDYKKEIKQEHETRKKHGYESRLYAKNELHSIIGSSEYYGAVRYPGTFGINTFEFLQAFKQVLLDYNVAIYEDTPAVTIEPNVVHTLHGKVKANFIVVCADYNVEQLHRLQDKVYHVQTCLMASEPLTETTQKKIFPEHPLMVWDTDLIYHYYRLTGDNRLLLGGADLFATFSSSSCHLPRLIKKLTNYYEKKFPHVPIRFDYAWNGFIGISKDILPLAGPDTNNSHIYYIACVAGLPWAAALGKYSAEHLLESRNDLDELFSPYRKFAINAGLQSILGKKISFALSNLIRVSSL